MLYLIRRREDDMYLTYGSDNSLHWQYNIDENCYFNQAQIDTFKAEMGEAAHDFLIYSIVNPCN